MFFQIRTLFTAASAKLKTIKGINLSLANKIYVKSCDCELNSQLKKDAVDVFDAELEKVDFGDSAAAAKLINGWVMVFTSPCYNEIRIDDNWIHFMMF